MRIPQSDIIPNTCALGQRFGDNLNNSYALLGLKGHTGKDISCGFGTQIFFPYEKGIVYKVLDKDNTTDKTGFTGVFVIVDDGIECFEYLVGHCDPLVKEGDVVSRGTILGTEANHGTVFSGNIQITLDMQKAGDQRGHHRHIQKRPVRRVLQTSNGELFHAPPSYLTSRVHSTQLGIQGDKYYDGGYYEVIDYYNGFNGCMDIEKSVFQRDLWFGCSGYDVFVLQGILQKDLLVGFERHPNFGPKTLSHLINYQRKYRIKPSVGYFGPKTRADVLSKWVV